MKKLIFLSVLFLSISCGQSRQELYSVTDSFVESLQSSFESYGVLGGGDYTKITSDSQYQVMPIGRLINVKILKTVTSEEYKKLEKDLKRHYKNDDRVKDIYINNLGTVMVDCRK